MFAFAVSAFSAAPLNFPVAPLCAPREQTGMISMRV